jgi:hypothetical protein
MDGWGCVPSALKFRDDSKCSFAYGNCIAVRCARQSTVHCSEWCSLPALVGLVLRALLEESRVREAWHCPTTPFSSNSAPIAGMLCWGIITPGEQTLDAARKRFIHVGQMLALTHFGGIVKEHDAT